MKVSKRLQAPKLHLRKAKNRHPKRGAGNALPLLAPVLRDGFIRPHDLARRYRVSLVTVWAWQRREVNPLPPPIQLSENVRAWPVDTILAWEASLPKGRTRAIKPQPPEAA